MDPLRCATTAAAARSINSVGSDAHAEGDRHESHVVSSCTGGRRNLNTTASRDTGLLLYSRRLLAGGDGSDGAATGIVGFCRIDNSDGSVIGSACTTGKGAEIVFTSTPCEPVECETQYFNE